MAARAGSPAAPRAQSNRAGIVRCDHILAEPGLAADGAWTTFAAVAMATTRVRLGALVTPLARRRPWVVGAEARPGRAADLGRGPLAEPSGR